MLLRLFPQCVPWPLQLLPSKPLHAHRLLLRTHSHTCSTVLLALCLNPSRRQFSHTSKALLTVPLKPHLRLIQNPCHTSSLLHHQKHKSTQNPLDNYKPKYPLRQSTPLSLIPTPLHRLRSHLRRNLSPSTLYRINPSLLLWPTKNRRQWRQCPLRKGECVWLVVS